MPPTSLQNLPKYRPEPLPLPPFPSPIPPACILYLPYRTNYSKPETQSACDNPGVTVGGGAGPRGISGSPCLSRSHDYMSFGRRMCDRAAVQQCDSWGHPCATVPTRTHAPFLRNWQAALPNTHPVDCVSGCRQRRRQQQAQHSRPMGQKQPSVGRNGCGGAASAQAGTPWWGWGCCSGGW